MTPLRLVVRNLLRHRGHTTFASLVIAIGVVTLCFFLALSIGVRQEVVARILPDTQIEVVPKTVQVGIFERQGGLFGGSGSGLDDATVEALRALPHVRDVYPKQQIGFPASVRGGSALIGEDLYAELLLDGVPPAIVEGVEQTGSYAFRDWESPTDCTSSDETACGPHQECVNGLCVAVSCVPSDELWWTDSAADAQRVAAEARLIIAGKNDVRVRRWQDASGRPRFAVTTSRLASDAQRLELVRMGVPGTPVERQRCEGDAYCHAASRRCAMPVPVLASPLLLELYNGNIQSMMRGMSGGMKAPRLNERAIIGLQATATLGEGMLGTSRGVRERGETTDEVQLRVVGFSPVALPIGATAPIGYVTRWNAQYGTKDAAGSYSSIVVETTTARAVEGVITHVRETMNLDIHPRVEAARKGISMLSIVMAIFAALGGLMVVIAAVNILQTYVMLVSERRRELGVLRSVGASRAAIVSLLLAEAALVGGIASVAGLALARLAAWGVDVLLRTQAPQFPFKPDTLFAFPASLWLLGLAVGIGAALVGALFPALRVGRLEPADALRERA